MKPLFTHIIFNIHQEFHSCMIMNACDKIKFLLLVWSIQKTCLNCSQGMDNILLYSLHIYSQWHVLCTYTFHLSHIWWNLILGYCNHRINMHYHCVRMDFHSTQLHIVCNQVQFVMVDILYEIMKQLINSCIPS